ncbi:MAG: c-type cytochrome [Ectothiorhodospiraceae bacterium]|nr:c-type cytochrome [Ectothiorhodospiraceae bacterium]
MKYIFSPQHWRRGVWIGLAFILMTGASTAAELNTYLRPGAIPQPSNNLMTPNRVKLGKMLFFDPRLSGSNWISCATCHNPAMGWSDGLPTAIGHGQKILGRSTPTILNSAYQPLFMWDGHARSLEKQALGPIENEGEMAQSIDNDNGKLISLLAELKALKGYRDAFEVAYPGEGITKKTIAKALSSFERSIVSSDAPFDLWIKGEKQTMSNAALRGFTLFEGKASCVKCHSGFNFTDNGFHNIGLEDATDAGRYAIRKVKILIGAFKTPTLRDVALTAPYMHNGAYSTLAEVVEHYNLGGHATENLSPNIKKLNLTATEKTDLVEFMKSLTGEITPVTYPVLPAE